MFVIRMGARARSIAARAKFVASRFGAAFGQGDNGTDVDDLLPSWDSYPARTPLSPPSVINMQANYSIAGPHAAPPPPSLPHTQRTRRGERVQMKKKLRAFSISCV